MEDRRTTIWLYGNTFYFDDYHIYLWLSGFLRTSFNSLYFEISIYLSNLIFKIVNFVRNVYKYLHINQYTKLKWRSSWERFCDFNTIIWYIYWISILTSHAAHSFLLQTLWYYSEGGCSKAYWLSCYLHIVNNTVFIEIRPWWCYSTNTNVVLTLGHITCLWIP